MFLDKGVKAVYIYHMPSYPFASEDQKKSILHALHNFFYVYRGKGKILLLNRTQTPDEILGKLDDLQQDNPFPKTYLKWKEDMRKSIEDNCPWRQELYFILDLPKKIQALDIDAGKALERAGIRGLFNEFYHNISNAGMSALGFTNSDIEEDEVQTAIAEEETLYNNFKNAGKIYKATPQDIHFMLKSPFYRELGEVPISKRDNPPVTKVLKEGRTYLRPQKAYMLDIFSDGWVEPSWRHIAIHNGDKDELGKTSYQTHLVLSGAPDSIEQVHNEWLYWLQEFSFPVDLCINFEIKDSAEELAEVRRKKYDMRGDLETQYESNMDSELDAENLDKGSELERKLAKGQPKMEMEVIACVAGKTKKIMKERAEEIKTFYGSRMFDFSIVPSKQVYCFEKFFPWAERDEYWTFHCDPGFVSGGGIHCTSELGTESGPWLGSTWNRKIVLADFGWPMRNNKPGTVVLLGSMGGGKSATMKKIIKTVLLMGGYGFGIDPKGEFHAFLQNKEIGEQSKLIKFGAGMDSARLNIFRTSSNFDRAWQTAKNYLSLVLNARKNEFRSLILNKVVKATMLSENPNIFVFMDNLRKYSAKEKDIERKREIDILIDMLDAYQEDPLAKIVFHDEPGEQSLEKYRLVIADTQGLKLPKKGEAGQNLDITQLDDTTKLSLGVVLLTGSMGRELMQHRSNSILKVYFVDEFWIMEGVEELQSLNKELVKMSRSQYVLPVFATQEGADVKTQDIRNNLGWVFCGKTESEEQIKDACSMLGITDLNEDIYTDFRNLESGNFFVRDPLGRKDIISIYQPADWLEMFDTTPKPKKKEKGSA